MLSEMTGTDKRWPCAQTAHTGRHETFTRFTRVTQPLHLPFKPGLRPSRLFFAPLTEGPMYFGIYQATRVLNEFETVGLHPADETPGLFASLLTWLRGIFH
jgi:hypothetical protein